MKKFLFFYILLLPFSELIAQMPETDIWVFDTYGEAALGTFTNGKNITNRPGYDNQPWFSSDEENIFWTSVRDSGETDIYCHNSNGTSRVTSTNVSEYSPMFIPGTHFMTAVVVEQDSTQRLWSYDETKADVVHPKTEILFPDLKGVAYYRWLDANTVFIADLPEPMTLYIGYLNSGKTIKVDESIGRSFGVYGDIMFYTKTDTSGNCWVTGLTNTGVHNDSLAPAIILPKGSQDFAIDKNGRIFSAQGTKLYSTMFNSGVWKLEHDFATNGLHKITRIAISPYGDLIALTDNL
ncbi:MAG: PD40 domain-containing protein [Bacteroidetes bacterium]|nr:PD40 domain-containing protein [Bacteroidota bacterium]